MNIFSDIEKEKHKTPIILFFFFDKLDMKINELENKKQFKVLWLNDKMKEEVGS